MASGEWCGPRRPKSGRPQEPRTRYAARRPYSHPAGPCRSTELTTPEYRRVELTHRLLQIRKVGASAFAAKHLQLARHLQSGIPDPDEIAEDIAVALARWEGIAQLPVMVLRPYLTGETGI
ncbi:hypothetical protein GCM10009550_69520 [Actinocorallia libanotica]|uniref:Uncharacterized protein n=1 Tax=Actinocorallia libanotica TaxID=46162 RepID=A0ABN1RWU9_9ACTN